MAGPDITTSSNHIEMLDYKINTKDLRDITFEEFASLVQMLSYSGSRYRLTPRSDVLLYHTLFSSMFENHPSILLEGDTVKFGITYDRQKHSYRVLEAIANSRNEYTTTSGFNILVKSFPLLFTEFEKKGDNERILKYYKLFGGYQGNIDELLLRAITSLRLQDYLLDRVKEHNQGTDLPAHMMNLTSSTGINRKFNVLEEYGDDLFNTKVCIGSHSWVDINPIIEDEESVDLFILRIDEGAEYEPLLDNTFEGTWGKVVGFYYNTYLKIG